MAIPLEPTKMRELIGRYRDAWRAAGHPGNGHVMNTFFMCCMPTREEAMRSGLAACNQHLRGLADAAKEWLTGASTKDYPGYDKLIAHVSSDTAERQVRQRQRLHRHAGRHRRDDPRLQRQGRRHRQRVAALHAGQHAGRTRPNARCGCSRARCCRRSRGSDGRSCSAVRFTAPSISAAHRHCRESAWPCRTARAKRRRGIRAPWRWGHTDSRPRT